MSKVSNTKCEVCVDNLSKYKCPKCLIPYCSLGCYKTHKEACVEPEVSEKTKPEEETTAEIETLTSVEAKVESTSSKVQMEDGECDDGDEEGNAVTKKLEADKTSEEDDEAYEDSEQDSIKSDVVSKERLRLLNNSVELKNIMANKHLRELLTSLNEHGVDTAHKMQQAMQEPLFQEFSEVCLKIVQKESDLNQ